VGVMSNQDLDFIDFMESYMDAFDDLNDGAWETVIKEGVEAFNKTYHRDLDPHEGFLHYIESGS